MPPVTADHTSQALWRRLDLLGHDAAWVSPAPGGGAELTGMAVFHEGEATALAYSVRCTQAWEADRARVRGWRGAAPVELVIARDAEGRWSLNDTPCPGVDGCVDLDLSFTPATNLIALRRLALAVGESARIITAWLDWPAIRLLPLAQRYTRLGPSSYDYEGDVPDSSPYRAELLVDENGWISSYPGLWSAWTMRNRS